MKRKFQRFASVFTAYYAGSCFTSAIVVYILNRGWGRGDFVPALVWGLPGSLGACMLIAWIAPKLDRLPVRGRLTLRILLALFLSVGAAATLPWLLGPWFGMLSVPPLPSSIAACLSAVFVAPWVHEGRWRQALGAILGFALVAGLALPLGAKGLKVLRGGGSLHVSSAVSETWGQPIDEAALRKAYCPHPPSGPAPELGRSPQHHFLSAICAPRDLDRLIAFHRSYGVPSRLRLDRSGLALAGYTKAKGAMLFVFEPGFRLKKNQEFFLPADDFVIYVVRQDKWELFPSDAKLSSRKGKIHTSSYTAEGKEYPILCLTVEDVGGRLEGSDCAFAPHTLGFTVEP